MPPIARRTALAGLLAAAFCASAPSFAATELRLDDALKAQLVAAAALDGRKVDRSLFDGRPLLVLFYASW